MGWLLSIADHIVEFVAKKQVMDNDTEMEVLIGLHLLHLRAAVLKAAMAINANCLMEKMSIPDTYIDTLPKNGREPASGTRCTGSSRTWSSTQTTSYRRWT